MYDVDIRIISIVPCMKKRTWCRLNAGLGNNHGIRRLEITSNHSNYKQ